MLVVLRLVARFLILPGKSESKANVSSPVIQGPILAGIGRETALPIVSSVAVIDTFYEDGHCARGLIADASLALISRNADVCRWPCRTSVSHLERCWGLIN